MGVIFTLKKFRHFLLSTPFRLFTDQQSLRHTFSQENIHGRISRWLSFLADYEFEIIYRPGRKNANADFCSRPFDASLPNPFGFEEEEGTVVVVQVEEPLQKVMSYLMSLGLTNPTETFEKSVRVKAKNFMVSEERLFRRVKRGLRYVPNIDDRTIILSELHDAIGHWDFEATYKMIADRYWWPSMRGDIAKYVRTYDN